MDDIMVRSRYPRRSAPGRRRKKNIRNGGTLPGTIIRQLAVSLLILAAAAIVKSVDAPVTNYVSDKIRYVLEQNIELKSIYQSVDNIIGKLKSNTLFKNNDAKVQGSPGKKLPPASSPPPEQQDDAAGLPASVSTGPPTSVLSASTDESFITEYSLITPVKGVLSSPFGERTDPVTKERKFHEGIDIETNKGSSIAAALGGTVSEAGASPSYGNYVKLNHNNGLVTVYAHCSVLNAEKGRAVKQGDVIGKVGDTGASVGVHLHFEIWKDGRPVNPLEYIGIPEQ